MTRRPHTWCATPPLLVPRRSAPCSFPKDVETFNRVAAYVEQNDIHSPLVTVREALHFSAKLRLPASVTHAQRVAFVSEVLHLLE